jgi:hypothetical protein
LSGLPWYKRLIDEIKEAQNQYQKCWEKLIGDEIIGELANANECINFYNFSKKNNIKKI